MSARVLDGLLHDVELLRSRVLDRQRRQHPNATSDQLGLLAVLETRRLLADLTGELAAEEAGELATAARAQRERAAAEPITWPVPR